MVNKKKAETSRILDVIKGSKALMEGRGKTTAIFPIIKKIILKATAHSPVGAKLPAIRFIAEALDTTVMPVQRTIHELVRDGALTSKPKSGVFVADIECSPMIDSLQETRLSSKTKNLNDYGNINFSTNSAWPWQRSFWKQIGNSYSQVYNASNADINYHFKDEDITENIDIKEISCRHYYEFAQTTPLLDLTQAPGLNHSGPTKQLLPIYNKTYFLFYNNKLLEQTGIKPPAYKTFCEQLDYLTKCTSAFKHNNLESHPFTIYQPATLLGKKIDSFINQATNSNELKTAIDTISKLYQTTQVVTRHTLGETNYHHDFLTEKCPFFLGYSVDYWEFEEQNLEFDWSVYPFLCLDNSLHLWPTFATVNAKTKRPVECIRFLKHLLSDGCQQQFTSIGNCPVTNQYKPWKRYQGDTSWLQDKLNQKHPESLTSAKDQYLAYNILNDELFSAVAEKQSWQQALNNALDYRDYYLELNK